MLRARNYGGPEDIPALQRLVGSLWAAEPSPPPPLHVGDVPWRLLSVPERVAEIETRLWEDGPEVVGFAWLTRPDELELAVAPGREDVLDRVLEWAHGVARDQLKVDSLDCRSRHRSALEAREYRPLGDDDVFFHHVRSLEDLPEPVPQPGFTLRPVRLPADLARRVQVHRSAFGTKERPSRLTEQSYAAVAASFPYRQELDWVVEAPDGTFAGFCLAWIDEENRVGLLEPVGAHAAHRRAGHASAACLGALHALAAAGAERAVVSANTEPARALYRSVGFVEVGRFEWLGRIASAAS